MSILISTLISLAHATPSLQSQLADWEMQHQEVLIDPKLSTFIADFAHVYNTVQITSGDFVGGQNDSLALMASTMSSTPDKSYSKHLRQKYLAYLSDSPGLGFSICFEGHQSDTLYMERQYFTTLLDSAGLEWNDIAPQSKVEYHFANGWREVSQRRLGEDLFKVFESGSILKQTLTLSATEIPNEFDSVLELRTEDDKKIRLPVSISSSQLFDDTELFWIVNDQRTDIQIDFKNPEHLRLFAQVYEDGSIAIRFRETQTAPTVNQSLKDLNLQVHLMDSNNHWFAREDFVVAQNVNVSTSEQCNLVLNYQVPRTDIMLLGLSSDNWEQVTQLKVIDTDIYEHRIAYTDAAYFGGNHRDQQAPFIGYKQFDDLIGRGALCEQYCQQVNTLSTRYVQGQMETTTSPLIDRSISLNECQSACENSSGYARCLEDALNAKLTISSLNMIESRVYAINYCQEGITEGLKERTELLNGRDSVGNNGDDIVEAPKAKSVEAKVTAPVQQGKIEEVYEPVVDSTPSTTETTETTNWESSEKVRVLENGHIYWQDVTISTAVHVDPTAGKLCKAIISVASDGTVSKVQLKSCNYNARKESQVISAIKATIFDVSGSALLKDGFTTTIPVSQIKVNVSTE